MTKILTQYPKNTTLLNHIENQILNILISPSRLSEIQNKTKLSRSTTEYNLKKLEFKKLIKRKLEGKRILYFKTEKRFQHIEHFNYPIFALPGITIYQGKNAVENIWSDIAQKPKESRLIGIQPRKSFNEGIRKASKKQVHDISQKISDQRFIIDAIVHEDFGQGLYQVYQQDAKIIAKTFLGRPEAIVKVPNNFLDEKAEIFLVGNEIFITDWYKEFAVKISNKNIYNLFISILHAVKAYGKRYEQGKHIESIISSSKK